MATQKTTAKPVLSTPPNAPRIALGFDGVTQRVVLATGDSAAMSAVLQAAIEKIANALLSQSRPLPHVHAVVCQHVLMLCLMGVVKQKKNNGVWYLTDTKFFSLKAFPPVSSVGIKGHKAKAFWNDEHLTFSGGITVHDDNIDAGIGSMVGTETMASLIAKALVHKQSTTIGKGKINYTTLMKDLDSFIDSYALKSKK